MEEIYTLTVLGKIICGSVIALLIFFVFIHVDKESKKVDEVAKEIEQGDE